MVWCMLYLIVEYINNCPFKISFYFSSIMLEFIQLGNISTFSELIFSAIKNLLSLSFSCVIHINKCFLIYKS